MAEKTHWLQNPNKNYLGHQDLPNGDDLILTIASAKFEEVKNPTLNISEVKRVVRWEEKKWKPFICNETNARMIIKVTGQKFMEDTNGCPIQLFVSQTKVKGQSVDCLRIRDIAPKKQKDFSAEKKKLESCKTLDELKNVYLKFSHEAKADKTILALKDSLKTNLT